MNDTTHTDDNQNVSKETRAELRAKDALKGEFGTGSSGEALESLFKPDELDLYVNKLTLEAYIFHGKDVDYKGIERLEYNADTYGIVVIKKDGTRLDLGVKAQWLIRPYFSKATEVNIIQTLNGKSVDGVIVPLTQKE